MLFVGGGLGRFAGILSSGLILLKNLFFVYMRGGPSRLVDMLRIRILIKEGWKFPMFTQSRRLAILVGVAETMELTNNDSIRMIGLDIMP